MILISGTGRSGTTFIMRLLTILGLDTGFSIDTMENFIFSNCNAGMEKDIDCGHLIIKNPKFSDMIPDIASTYKIDLVIIPVRRNDEVTASRETNGPNAAGGIFLAGGRKTQAETNEYLLSKLVTDCALLEVPMIFLNFYSMTTDPAYLFNKLNSMVGIFPREVFDAAWEKASALSRPHLPMSEV